MTPTFSIVICSYNRPAFLARSIESACAQRYDGEFDVIIVDNSSDTGAAEASRRAAEAKAPGIRYHISDTPGLSRARNLALDISTASHVAFLDDDAVAADGWLAALAAAFGDPGAKVGVAGGRVRPEWGCVPPTWLLPAGVDTREVANRDFPMVGNFSVVNWGGVLRAPAPGEWLAGANLAFDRSGLLAAGGFDVALGRTGDGIALMSNEESAATDRMKRQGWQVRYVPDAVVDHHVPAARLEKSWLVRRVAWQLVSDLVGVGSDTLLAPKQLEERLAAAFGPGVRQADDDEAITFRREVLGYVALLQALLAGDMARLESLPWQAHDQ